MGLMLYFKYKSYARLMFFYYVITHHENNHKILKARILAHQRVRVRPGVRK